MALMSDHADTGRKYVQGVSLEEAALGKFSGEGWTISAGFAVSPFGQCFVAVSPKGVCRLAFVDSTEIMVEEWAGLQKKWPKARLHRDDFTASQLAKQIFLQPVRPVSAYVQGTLFQLRVWRTLLLIPPGTLVSYGHLAAVLGKPAAARAVGTAVAQNPVAYLIPCHRVIPASGLIGNYHWGGIRKQAILAWEISAYFPTDKAAGESLL